MKMPKKKGFSPTPKAGFTILRLTAFSLVKVQSLFCFNPNTLINHFNRLMTLNIHPWASLGMATHSSIIIGTSLVAQLV